MEDSRRERRRPLFHELAGCLRHVIHLQAAQHDNDRRPRRIMTHGGSASATATAADAAKLE